MVKMYTIKKHFKRDLEVIQFWKKQLVPTSLQLG